MGGRKKVSFDQNLKDLENIVEKLNQEDLPLEEGVQLFKQGMEILEKCKEQLNKAKDEVKIYLENTKNNNKDEN
ncbi:MAG: Exodeoxyribonuclease 7 small subunit [Desulfonauticus sp. 38_4375]|jgi:exodeoxyribonuclease VII small subunit|nr:MAG: Exodeoxyribonuclease 7 small subunit [Desulfonauticus sp. 38_4375]